MFQIEQLLKDGKRILKDGIRHYAKGCEDLIKKNESLMAEKLKFEETVKVLKEQNISQMKKLNDLQNKNYDLEYHLKTLRYDSEKSLQSLTKLNDSEFKFVKMLTRQKGYNDKRGYNNAKYRVKPHLLKVHTSIDSCLFAPIVAKKNILSLHVPTNVRTTISSRIPFLMNYVSRKKNMA